MAETTTIEAQFETPIETSIEARRLAGKLMMIRFPGTELDDDMARFLRDNAIRAVCLFRQNMRDAAQLAKLTADLRAVMGPASLIAIDQEGGAVVRATWLPQPPAAMALGAANDVQLARAVGAAVARGVKSLGFNWNFAPVLDLNNNPDNPVIAERSFGADPARATELAMAWMEGSMAEGIACCVKHFPGHGDTHVDSHRDLPTVDKPVAALDALELAPFRAAALRRAPAMMTAHIVYPALDDEYPATLSRKILTGLLREQWGYRGIVITDGMDMHAIANRYGTGSAAVRALIAGTDMVMALGTRETQEETLAEIAKSIEDGSLDLRDMSARIERLDRLALDYPCAPCAYDNDPKDRALMTSAWYRALTPYGRPRAPKRGAQVRLVVRADVVSDGVSEAGIPAQQVATMLERLYDVDMVTFRSADDFDWNALPDDGRFTMLASTSRARYAERVRANWRPDLHLALWNPFQALDIAAPALITYGSAQPALDAVAAWLAGEIEATGRVPVAGFGG